jgi:hypothetical protein
MSSSHSFLLFKDFLQHCFLLLLLFNFPVSNSQQGITTETTITTTTTPTIPISLQQTTPQQNNLTTNSLFRRGNISTFNNNDGIIRVQKQDICIYTDYHGMYGEVDVLRWTATIKEVKTRLEEFSAKISSPSGKKLGITNIRIRDKREIEQVTAETTFADALGWIISNFTLTRIPFNDITDRFMRIYSSSDTFVSPQPNLKLDINHLIRAEVPHLHKVEFSASLKKKEWTALASVIQFYLSNNKKYTTDTKETTFKEPEKHDEFQLYQSAIILTKTLLDELEEILDQLDENFLPPGLFEASNFTQTVQNFINQNVGNIFQIAEINAILQNNPLTFPFSKGFGTKFQIITFIPVGTEMNRYEHWKLLALPTFQDGVFIDNWKRVNLPIIHYLKKGTQEIPFRKEELHCLQGMTEMSCTLCLKLENTIEINECTRALIQGSNALEVCENQALSNVTDLVIKLNKTTWAFVDSNPGSIAEDCPNQTPTNKQLALPHSGIISINPECNYVMTNTPVTIEEIDDDLTVSIVNRNDITYYTYNPAEDSLFKHHLKKYSFRYFLALSIFSSILVLGTSFYCVINQRTNRIRIGFRRVPRRTIATSETFFNPPSENRGPVVQFIRRDGLEFIN